MTPLLSLPAHALLWLLAPVQVPAPPDAATGWRAPPGCPDHEALLGAVARRLGRPLAADEVTIDAGIVGDDRRGYTLHLSLTAGARSETREVHDPSCAALTDAAALRVVAVLESTAVPLPLTSTIETKPAEIPDTTPAAPEIPEPTPVASPPKLPVPARPEPAPGDSFDAPGGVLRVHGGGELGAVPKPTGAAGLALGLLWPRLRLELQGTVLAPRTLSVPSGSVRAGLFAGAVHACGRAGRGALEFPLCAGLEVGALRGEARQLSGSRAATAWWVAAVLGPGLAWHLGRRFSVWASLQLVLAPVRPDFQQGEGKEAKTLFKPPVASGRLLVGVELRLRDPW